MSGELGGEEFECDRPLELQVLGAINGAHAAFAQLAGNAIVGNRLPNHLTKCPWNSLSDSKLPRTVCASRVITPSSRLRVEAIQQSLEARKTAERGEIGIVHDPVPVDTVLAAV